MDIFLKIDLNLFAFVICCGMYIANKLASEKYMTQNRLFRAVILLTMVLLLLDVATWMLDGQPGVFMNAANYAAETLGFILTPIPAMIWALYSSYQVFSDMRRLKIEAAVLSIPVILCALLSLSSIFTGWVFTIDGSNIYHRGPLFFIVVAVTYLELIYVAAAFIYHRKMISRKLFIPMLLFTVPPIIGAVIQLMFYGVTLLWSSITISIFIVHTSVQNKQFYLDHLTGVFNRRQMDNYLYNRIQNAKGGKDFSCIMLDIDNFKTINDTYGHVVGDDALVSAAHLLRSCIRNEDFLARYAGDEFIIILDISDETLLKSTIERIQAKAALYNQTSLKPFTLSFSAGYDIYRHNEPVSRDDFVTHVDSLMYADKNGKKAALE